MIAGRRIILKKKLIIAAIVVALFIVGIAVFAATSIFNLFNIGISPLEKADGKEQTGRRLEVSFSYDKQLMVASSQYAIWVEDMGGNYVDTLYVTRYTAQEGYHRRPKSIPQWVSVANPAEMQPLEIDVISGATPRSGAYRVFWDFTDRSGNLVTGDEYRYFFEATMYNDDDVMYSGVISIGNDEWEQFPIPEYSVPNSEYKAMIENVRVAYYPD